jgi:hypothetical protein
MVTFMHFLRIVFGFVVTFAIGGSAIAGPDRCEELFTKRKFVADLLARKRFVVMVSSRSRSVPAAQGGVTSISNPRPDFRPEHDTSNGNGRNFRPLRDTSGQEAVAIQLLQAHRVFSQKISADGTAASEVSASDGRSVVTSSYDGLLTGRYTHRFFIGENSERVEISGRAIVTLAEIIHALKRIELPINPAKLIGAYTAPFFGRYMGHFGSRDHINHLEYITTLTSSELAAIDLANRAERQLGIKEADVATWFDYVLASARGDRGTQLVVAPGLVLRTFYAGLREGSIRASNGELQNEAAQSRWIEAANKVVNETLLPRIEKDFEEAVLRSDLVVRETYVAAIEQFATPHSTARVGAVLSRTGAAQIRSNYRNSTGLEITASEAVDLNLKFRETKGRVRNSQLLEAVMRYLVVYKDGYKSRFVLNDFVEFSRTGIGDREIEAAYSDFVTEMLRFGYSRHEVIDAVTLLVTHGK